MNPPDTMQNQKKIIQPKPKTLVKCKQNYLLIRPSNHLEHTLEDNTDAPSSRVRDLGVLEGVPTDVGRSACLGLVRLCELGGILTGLDGAGKVGGGGSEGRDEGLKRIDKRAGRGAGWNAWGRSGKLGVRLEGRERKRKGEH
jgi:hypothetical protein